MITRAKNYTNKNKTKQKNPKNRQSEHCGKGEGEKVYKR